MILENNKINPDLLYRLFKKSNKYATLVIHKYGIRIVYEKTQYGTIAMKMPTTKEYYQALIS